MRTISVCQAGRHYCIDGISWGDDADCVLRYLRAQGITPEESAKAAAGVAQAGGETLQQA
jgi:hypothetical protein